MRLKHKQKGIKSFRRFEGCLSNKNQAKFPKIDIRDKKLPFKFNYDL